MRDLTALHHPVQCAFCMLVSPPAETRLVRCNVRRFRDRSFSVWRCRQCRSLHCEPVDNLPDYYDGYPIRSQALDYFSRAWYQVVLTRLRRAGLRPRDKILDFGCNQGLLIKFLKENGFQNCHGFDPYVSQYNSTDVLDEKYDFVISLDVIEHDTEPKAFLGRLASLLKPNGKLCLETPNAEGIDLDEPEEYLHALHVPYHVHILSQTALTDLSRQLGLRQVAAFNRWYMDSWQPGTARRLFESLLKFGDNDIDSGYEPPRLALFFHHPVLLLYLFFGYFLPAHKTDHMMMILSAQDSK